MHNKTPRMFTFVDNYQPNILDNININVGIIYRNYTNFSNIKEILKIKEYCKKKRFKFFISNDINLALKSKCDGIYIPSFNKTLRLNHKILSKNFTIMGSAHNHQEIKQKIHQKCVLIFVSPIFKTDKNNKFLDLFKFRLLINGYNKKFIALGGINETNIKKTNMAKISGICAISYFQKKTGLIS